MGPERFRPALAARRCSFGGPTPAGRIALQTANYAVAVPVPERLWEISPSVVRCRTLSCNESDSRSSTERRQCRREATSGLHSEKGDVGAREEGRGRSSKDAATKRI